MKATPQSSWTGIAITPPPQEAAQPSNPADGLPDRGGRLGRIHAPMDLAPQGFPLRLAEPLGDAGVGLFAGGFAQAQNPPGHHLIDRQGPVQSWGRCQRALFNAAAPLEHSVKDFNLPPLGVPAHADDGLLGRSDGNRGPQAPADRFGAFGPTRFVSLAPPNPQRAQVSGPARRLQGALGPAHRPRGPTAGLLFEPADAHFQRRGPGPGAPPFPQGLGLIFQGAIVTTAHQQMNPRVGGDCAASVGPAVRLSAPLTLSLSASLR